MPALDLIPSAYDALKSSRRAKEEESRVKINREMDALRGEFDALVARAIDAEKAKVSDVARAMDASRTTVYASLERHRAAVVAGATYAGTNIVKLAEHARFTLSLDPNYDPTEPPANPAYPKGPELVTISFTPAEHAAFWEDKRRHIRGGGKVPPADLTSTRRLDRVNGIVWAEENPTTRDTTNERVYDSTITAWLNFHGGTAELFAWLEENHPVPLAPLHAAPVAPTAAVA